MTHRGGLVLAARVHGADLPEREGGRLLLEEEREGLARMELLWADGAYTGGFWEWLRNRLGWRLEVSRHRDRQRDVTLQVLKEKPRGFLWCCRDAGWWRGCSRGWGSRAASAKRL